MPLNRFHRAYDAMNIDVNVSSSGGGGANYKNQTEIARLEARVERLALLCEAMWVVIRENTKFTDEMLLDMVTQIDLEDGKMDGKVDRGKIITCHSCGRTNSKRFAKCMYCGAPAATTPFD